ncbi:glycosyltransferase [Ideonella dechloratans]|uniref:glycosyltransferase n=1 Tax=Ideonella dechloratans TaxID=36863 RepID=UPI0035B025C1
MRLLYLIAEDWPTHRADLVALFGKYLPRRGVMSDIVCGSEALPPPNWPGGQALCCPLRGGMARRRASTFWHACKVLWQRGRLEHCDAIQVRDMPAVATVAWLVARWRGLPLYYWMSYPIPDGQIATALERGLSSGWMKFLYPLLVGALGRVLLYRWVLRQADHVFVQSAQMKRDLQARGIPGGRMTPVPMGVDLEVMQPEQIEPMVDDRLLGRRVLVYLGTLDRTRRPEVMLDMLALLRQQEPQALLVMAGDDPDPVHLASLKQHAANQGVAEHVIWTGWLPMAQAWRWVKAAEVALSPFPRGYLLDSASPTKVPEYLMLGVPVVCNDNPDQEDLIKRLGGGLVKPYTAEEFLLGVGELLQGNCFSRHSAAQGISGERDYEMLANYVANEYSRLNKVDNG